MVGVLILLVLYLLAFVGFFLNLMVFRSLGSSQSIAIQLRRLSGLPILVIFYFILAVPLSICFAGPYILNIIGYFFGFGLLAMELSLSQFVIYYLTLLESVTIHRARLSTENQEIKDQLVWYLRNFAWIPLKRVKKEELENIIAQLTREERE